MAHNLHQMANGQYSMFSTRERGKPWHGLGQTTAGAVTWEEATKQAGLDWTVSKHQLTSPIDGRLIDSYGIFRDDNQNFLGNVGSVYEPIQNSAAGTALDILLEAEKGAHYESAGALGTGSKIWYLARVPHDFSITGTADKHETYLMFTSAHDGTESALIKLTTVRVVCQNTLNAALRQGMASLRVRHTASGTERLEAASKLIGGITATVKTLSDKLNILASRKVGKTECRQVMEKVFGEDWSASTKKKNNAMEIARLFDSNDRDAIPEVRGTAYNLLNACTEWSDHYKGVRQTSGRSGMSEQQIRKQGALFEYDNWKDQVLDSILQITAACPTKDLQPVSVPVSSKVDSILSMVA
jgi:phage/plasmid-like protein (TIGR03299 family)